MQTSSRCGSPVFELRELHRDGGRAYHEAPSRPAQLPGVVAHGTLETPEFQRQTRDFAAAVKAAGKPISFLVAEGYNHFEIHETIASPYGLLGREVLEQTKLD